LREGLARVARAKTNVPIAGRHIQVVHLFHELVNLFIELVHLLSELVHLIHNLPKLLIRTHEPPYGKTDGITRGWPREDDNPATFFCHPMITTAARPAVILCLLNDLPPAVIPRPPRNLVFPAEHSGEHYRTNDV